MLSHTMENPDSRTQATFSYQTEEIRKALGRIKEELHLLCDSFMTQMMARKQELESNRNAAYYWRFLHEQIHHLQVSIGNIEKCQIQSAQIGQYFSPNIMSQPCPYMYPPLIPQEEKQTSRPRINLNS